MELKEVIEMLCGMNDPKYINALQRISQACREKSDILTNLQTIQNQYNSAQHKIEECNNKLKELIEE